MEIGLGIFAKTAGLSPVKTRLAAGIGEVKAQEFYALSVRAIEDVAKALPSMIHPHWAVAEYEGLAAQQWKSLPHFWTGEGDLGQRLHQVYSHLRQQHGAAMLIGTDSPQLSPALLQHAQETLRQHPQSIVMAPCDDGGFTLFAAAVEISATMWESVEYSHSTTLVQLIEQLEAVGWQVKKLVSQQDVDVVEDLTSLKVTLQKKQNLLPAQRQLLRWLEER